MKKLVSTILLLSILPLSQLAAKDLLLDLLKQELKEQMAELKNEELPPYQLNYRVIDKQSSYVTTSFGAIMNEGCFRQRNFVPQVRIGNQELDNFKERDMGASSNGRSLPFGVLPLEDEGGEDAIRQVIWDETKDRYKFAVSAYQNDIAKQSVNVEQEDKAPCFSKAPVVTYYEAPIPAAKTTLDREHWGKRLKAISDLFNADPMIMAGSATISYVFERRYFVDSEGTEVVQNLPYARIMVQGTTKAEDGMELPLSLSYFAYDPSTLPSNETIIADTKKMIAKLAELRVAPIVDPFAGPAMLSGAASGVFFHEIFGHRVEGQRMKRESDGQTFKKMVGELVLPADMQVCDDPTLNSFNGKDLYGFYKYDDQGVKAERVNVVVDGKLNDFLMTRTPIDNHPRSNGHARAEGGFDPVSRQSNLMISTKNPKTDAELRELLIAEAKKQSKEYGFFFKEVTGGFTYTGKGGTNSFNVTPLEVYRVYVDGRPDQLVRGVDLIGTPLSMFSNIIYAGGEEQIFTGMCGAESGQIPVTAISPTILVNKVEMQRKAKAQNMLPILKRP